MNKEILVGAGVRSCFQSTGRLMLLSHKTNQEVWSDLIPTLQRQNGQLERQVSGSQVCVLSHRPLYFPSHCPPGNVREKKEWVSLRTMPRSWADGMGIIPHDMVFILDIVQNVISGYKNKPHWSKTVGSLQGVLWGKFWRWGVGGGTTQNSEHLRHSHALGIPTISLFPQEWWPLDGPLAASPQ